MKKLGIIIFAAALVIGLVVSNIFPFGHFRGEFFHLSMSFSGEKGSGKIATQQREVRSFKGIEVGGVFEVDVTAGRDFSLEVETDDNLLPLVKTYVHDGVLEIESERRLSPTKGIKVRITAPDINDLDVSGAANLSLNGVKNAELKVDSSGASKVKVKGETAELSMNASGASKVDADGLRSAKVDVEASGASRSEEHTSELQSRFGIS